MGTCLFCRDDSSSTAVEHIIPQSLGNSDDVLDKGVVCDGCNNYLARKVEKPFLDLEWLRHRRLVHGVENKRGRLPVISASMLETGVPVTLKPDEQERRRSKRGRPVVPQVAPAIGGEFVLETETTLRDHPRVTSRFVAKVGFEYLARDMAFHGDPVYALNPQFDPLRRYVRRNEGPDWPVAIRPIFRDDAVVLKPDGSRSRPLICSLFHNVPRTSGSDEPTAPDRYYVLALFGVEIAINLTLPTTASYRAWVWRHAHTSPIRQRFGTRLVERTRGTVRDDVGFHLVWEKGRRG